MSTFLTTKQAAERIGVSKNTLLRRLHSGKPVPPVVRLDKRTLRWRADAVDAWIEAHTQADSTGALLR